MVTIINQALVDKEGSSYYYLPFTPRVPPTTAISSPFYMSMGATQRSSSIIGSNYWTLVHRCLLNVFILRCIC